MIFMTDWHGCTICSLSIGGAQLMHGPFSKILWGGPTSPRIDAPVARHRVGGEKYRLQSCISRACMHIRCVARKKWSSLLMCWFDALLVCFSEHDLYRQRLPINHQLNQSWREHVIDKRLHDSSRQMSTQWSAAGQHGQPLHLPWRSVDSPHSTLMHRSVYWAIYRV